MVSNFFSINQKNNISVIDLNDNVEIFDYQINIVNSSEIGIIPISKYQHNTSKKILCDTKKYITIKEYLKEREYNPDLVRKIILEVYHIIVISEKYMLFADNFLIDEKYIYIDENEKVKLMYVPVNSNSSWKSEFEKFIIKSCIAIKMRKYNCRWINAVIDSLDIGVENSMYELSNYENTKITYTNISHIMFIATIVVIAIFIAVLGKHILA